MLICGITCTSITNKLTYILKFYPTTAIFLVLLILDIVYLVLEWYYVHNGKDKLSAKVADRKITKQAQAEAEYKQSNEYRIEQLEKELQELKAKNDNTDDD